MTLPHSCPTFPIYSNHAFPTASVWQRIHKIALGWGTKDDSSRKAQLAPKTLVRLLDYRSVVAVTWTKSSCANYPATLPRYKMRPLIPVWIHISSWLLAKRILNHWRIPLLFKLIRALAYASMPHCIAFSGNEAPGVVASSLKPKKGYNFSDRLLFPLLFPEPQTWVQSASFPVTGLIATHF